MRTTSWQRWRPHGFCLGRQCVCRFRLTSPSLVHFRSSLAAGVDDWGGVSPLTPDHVNPERPWPHLRALADQTARAGFVLRERLTVHPSYARRGERWVDPRVQPHVDALVEGNGLAREGVQPQGLPWQEPDQLVDLGRVDLHVAIDSEGRRTAERSDSEEAFGSWDEVAVAAGVQASELRLPPTFVTPSVSPKVIQPLCCCHRMRRVRWRF